jgi:hypothetical protein
MNINLKHNMRFFAFMLVLTAFMFSIGFGASVGFMDGGNLVLNPGFETGSLSPWTNWQDTSVVDNNAHTGTYTVRITGEGSAEQVVSGLTDNITYTLTAWGKAETEGDEICIGAKNYDNSGFQVVACLNSTSYTQGTVSFTSADGLQSVKVFCYHAASGAAYCDDYSLTVQTTPPPGGSVQPSAPGIPDGFVLRSILCDVPVYNLAGGQPVGDDHITAGQTWYVNPTPVAAVDGTPWIEIFVGSRPNPYIPAHCVSGFEANVESALTGNLPLNPGFETGSFGPWTTWQNVLIVNNNAYTGTYAVQITGEGSAEQVVSGLTETTTYTLTAWGKVETEGDEICIGAKNYDSSGGQVVACLNSTSYSQGTVSFTIMEGLQSVKVFCYHAAAGITGYCDDYNLDF